MTQPGAVQLMQNYASGDVAANGGPVPGEIEKVSIEGLEDGMPAATSAVSGIVELATDAESKAGTDTTRAVTPANMTAVIANLRLGSFDGRNGAGACTLTGAVIGDRVVGVAGITGGALGIADSSFESTITVNDQIQQSAVGDLSGNDYIVILHPIA